MSTQARFVYDNNTYDLLAHGWHIPVRWTPPGMSYTPLLATGTPAADYAGGELVEEFVSDVAFSLPLYYKGDEPQAARRALEAFLRAGLRTKRLKLQLRRDRAFSMAPLWGQWGAWQTYELVHVGSLAADERIWVGDEKDYSYAALAVTARPAVAGQGQVLANAKGDVTENIGADGLSQGVTVAVAADTFLQAPASTLLGSDATIVIGWVSGGEPTGSGTVFGKAFGVLLAWINPDNKWQLDDGTTLWNSSSTTFPAAGTLVIFHITYETGGDIALYINGELQHNMAFTPFSDTGIVRIGHGGSGTSQIGGVFRFLSTYETAMSAAEVADDYNDVAQVLAAGPSPSPIPYLLTLAGDGVINNTLDASGSTGAPHQNYGIVAGVPGSLPAKYLLNAQTSANLSAVGYVYLACNQFEAITDPDGLLFDDNANSSASASSTGGGYTAAVSTPGGVYFDISLADYQKIAGRMAHGLFRAAGLTANGYIQLQIIIGGRTISSTAVPFNSSSSFRLEKTRPVYLPKLEEVFTAAGGGAELSGTVRFYFYITRSSGSGGYNADHKMILLDPMIRISTDIAQAGFVYDGRTVAIYNTTGTAWNGNAAVTGNPLQFVPHQYNYLFVAMGSNGIDPLISWTLTVNGLTVTPRWSVL